MQASSAGNGLTDDRGDRLRTLVYDLLLDVLRRHNVGLFAFETEVGAIAIRMRHVGDAVHEGPEPGLIAGSRDAHRAVGHAVVRAAAGDDLVALGEAAHRLDLLGDLDGGLDRFRSAGAEE